MIAEARYKKNEQEIAIDSLNKAQSSEFMQLFMVCQTIIELFIESLIMLINLTLFSYFALFLAML